MYNHIFAVLKKTMQFGCKFVKITYDVSAGAAEKAVVEMKEFHNWN
jgi:hypothetical protein